MSSINNEISIINEGKSNIASSLIAKFGVPKKNLLNDDGSLKRLTEWNLDGVSQYWADQKVSSTSNKETTPQVAKIGINTEISSNANTVLNVKGDSILTGNITITGNIINDGITAKLSSFLRIDGSNVTREGVSTLINKLSTGSSTPVDADYYISQSVGGGTTDTTYYRRPMSALWKWIYPKTISKSESVSYGGVTINPGNSNEINFGSSTRDLFFGYRKVGNSTIPTNYIFGSREGTATITSKGFCKTGSTDEYLLTGGGGHIAKSSFLTNSDLLEANLEWGGKNQINSSSPIDFILNPFLSGNKLAALTRSDVSLYREISTNGTSWIDWTNSDNDKKVFMGDNDYQSQNNLTTGGTLNTSASAASTGKMQVRISALCRKGSDIYASFSLNKIILSMGASSYTGTDYDYFKLECGKNATDAKGTDATWTTIVNWTPVRGYPGFNTINFKRIQVGIHSSDYNIIRFTFKGGCSCAKILGFGDYANYWRSNYIGLYGRPYTIDHNGLTTFMGGISIPGNLSASGTTNLGTTIIGTSSSTKGLTIHGNINATGWTKIGSTLNVSGKTTLGSSSTSADLQVYGSINATKNITASAFYESSDKNLKEDITSISVIDLARDIQLKEFRFRADGIKRYGVIAQDLLEEGLDNLVSTKDNHLTVDYISLLCLKIAQLEEEIKKIKMKLL